MGTAKSEANSPGMSWKCSYVLLLLSLFSRVRLCDPIDGNPPDSPVLGILQARTLEWIAISFSSSYVQEPLKKKKKKLLKDQSFFPCPGLSSLTQLNH